MRLLAATCVLTLGLLHDAAFACGDRSEQWYEDVSDIIFDGTARCDVEMAKCTIRVTKVLKNPLNLSVTGRTIEIDFYDWHRDPLNVLPNTIVLACGVPVFEPNLTNFRGRFYATVIPKAKN